MSEEESACSAPARIATTDASPPATGVFELRVYRCGVLEHEFVEPNLVVDAAKDAHAKLIGGSGSGKPVNRIGFGTNGTPPVPGDTALTGATLKPVGKVSYPSTGKVSFSWTLAANEAVGKKIAEFGLICSDGSLYARKTRAPIEKTDDMTLSGSWTITF